MNLTKDMKDLYTENKMLLKEIKGQTNNQPKGQTNKKIDKKLLFSWIGRQYC